MLKASSLFYAVVISLIISIVSSSLILFAYLTKIESEKLEISQQLRLNVDSGINLLLSNQSIVAINSEKEIDLFGKGNDKVKLGRKYWGAYEVVFSNASFKNESISRVVLSGNSPDSSKKYSLYMADEDKPLALCGKTKIKGTTFLPKAGVKRAYIEGQNFIGANLIDGIIKQSDKFIPEFNKETLVNIKNLLDKKSVGINDSVIAIGTELSENFVTNNFNNKTIVYSSEVTLKISSGIYTGNIAIFSSKQISISNAAVLNDVILAAPKIIIEKGFKGNLQAFASDSIILEKEVSLYYPSVLGIVKSEKIKIATIVLNGKDSISGSLFSYKGTNDALSQTAIILKKDTFVQGEVYTNGYADIQGNIYGSLTCSKIMLSTPSSVYENHLLNAIIDQTSLSKYYVGIISSETQKIKKIIKYLE